MFRPENCSTRVRIYYIQYQSVSYSKMFFRYCVIVICDDLRHPLCSSCTRQPARYKTVGKRCFSPSWMLPIESREVIVCCLSFFLSSVNRLCVSIFSSITERFNAWGVALVFKTGASFMRHDWPTSRIISLAGAVALPQHAQAAAQQVLDAA